MSAASSLRVLLLAVLNLIIISCTVAPAVLPVALQCYNSTGDPGSYNYGSIDFNTVAFTNSGRSAHTYYTDITYANYGSSTIVVVIGSILAVLGGVALLVTLLGWLQLQIYKEVYATISMTYQELVHTTSEFVEEKRHGESVFGGVHKGTPSSTRENVAIEKI